MSQKYFKENLAATQAEIDKRVAERDLMLENTLDEAKRKKAEWDLQVASSKIYKEQTFPKTAEMKQPQVAQIGEQEKKHSQQIIDEYITIMTALSAVEQPTAAQPDYPDEYKPRSR